MDETVNTEDIPRLGHKTKRQIITIIAAITAAFSVFYSVVFNTAVSAAIGLCYCQSVEEKDLCVESCCAGFGTTTDCCCSYSKTHNQTKTLITYETFGKSIYNYMCSIYKYDNSILKGLYNVNCEIYCTPKYIVYKIFKPPKSV